MCVVVVQVVVEDNIIVIPDVSVVNLNQVCRVFNMCLLVSFEGT